MAVMLDRRRGLGNGSSRAIMGGGGELDLGEVSVVEGP
jgi:hypothetical protein